METKRQLVLKRPQLNYLNNFRAMNLIERIKELRLEIKALKYERNGIQKQIDQKEDVLEELEKLTVNQLDMFPEADLSNADGR